MPNRVGDAIEAIENHDPSAREEVELAKQPNPEGDALLRDTGLFIAGFGALLLLAKRAR